jgi:hypothetical protein
MAARDGEIGHVVEFLFDDQRWTVRYLIAQTGGFMDGRRVLISPISFREADWSGRRFQLALTVDKIKHSPSVDLDKPVSRQHERDYLQYYGYPSYWGYPGLWGSGPHPSLLAAGVWSETLADIHETAGDPHLRSTKSVRGYHIQGSDDAIGHVDDFIVDDDTWEIRYLVVDTSNWWLGKKVLVAPTWAKRISWEESKVYLDLSRDVIRSSPAWNPNSPINREYETRMYDYYGRPAYWQHGAP